MLEAFANKLNFRSLKNVHYFAFSFKFLASVVLKTRKKGHTLQTLFRKTKFSV